MLAFDATSKAKHPSQSFSVLLTVGRDNKNFTTSDWSHDEAMVYAGMVVYWVWREVEKEETEKKVELR